MRTIIRKGLIFLLIVMFAGLCGCGKKETNLDEMLSDSLFAALNNVKELDSENIPQYILYIEDNTKFEISNSKQSGNTATATVIIESPDLYTAIKNMEWNKEYSNEELINEDIIASMKRTPMLTCEEVLKFELVDGEFKPVFTDSFINACYGGGMGLREEWIQSILGGSDYD